MATSKRTYPNDYFAWYNDDNRLAIIVQDTTSDSTERTTEKYDTYQSDDVSEGIRVYYNSKYLSIDELTDDLYSDAGVDSGLQVCILYYIKARLYEDAGDMEKSQYFRKLFYRELKQYPTRRSGTRRLAVPHL